MKNRELRREHWVMEDGLQFAPRMRAADYPGNPRYGMPYAAGDLPVGVDLETEFVGNVLSAALRLMLFPELIAIPSYSAEEKSL